MATGAFPYGKREKSFIEPELKYLVQHYDVTIISHAYPEELSDEQNISELDERIKVCHVDIYSKITWARKMIYGLRFFCDPDGWKEFADILKSGENILGRLYQSIGFYALAMIDYKEIRRNKVIVHGDAVYYTYWYFYYCYSVIKFRRKFPGLKLISRTHGFELYNDRYIGGRQPFKKIMDPGLDKLVFASDFAQKYYMGSYAIADDRDKYHVCKLGTDKRVTAEKKERQDQDFLLISCSNVVDVKRIELIIEGLSLIGDDRIHWVHIGEGDKSEELQALAKKALSPNIKWEFAGYLANEEIHRFYSENYVDCFITASRSEGGCPVSIQEAMAYGIPVIGTDVGGITEMIQGNGILLSCDPDAEEIKDAVMRMLCLSDGERLKMREASERIWRTEYNIKENVNKFIGILNQL